MESIDVQDGDGAEDEPSISVQRSCPGRTVFTEDDNPNGWIGTDLTVDVEP